MNKSDKILVTGAAGFIGSALVWKLNCSGYENIILTDRLESDDKWKNLLSLNYLDYFECDNLFQKLFSGQLDDIKYVFHLGACSSTTETNNTFLIQNNYEFTKILAEWCIKNGKKMIYASSAATYGDGSYGMNDGVDNLEKLRPLNMYGYSKHLFDLYAKKMDWFNGSNGLIGLKYFNVFGPNEYHKGSMRSLVNKAYSEISNTREVSLFKSYNPKYKHGEQLRDFIYVKDAVNMTIHLAKANSSGLFNIGSGLAHTWIDLVNPIFKSLNIEPKIKFVDMPDSIREKYQYYTCANIDRFINTGWDKITYTLENSVSEYVTNYLVKNKYLGENQYNYF